MCSQDNREAASSVWAEVFQAQFTANSGTVSLETLRSEPHLHAMPDKTYLIRFKRSDLSSLLVIASSAEIHGEHLIFLRSDGRLTALFVLEIVESWSERDSQ